MEFRSEYVMGWKQREGGGGEMHGGGPQWAEPKADTHNHLGSKKK